jgi:hypothetical protein
VNFKAREIVLFYGANVIYLSLYCLLDNKPLSCRGSSDAQLLLIFIMLKIRIIAVIIAILLTIGTVYLVPVLVYHYKNLVGGFSKDQQIWFNWFQAAVGALIAIYGFWRWKKSKSKPKE